MRSVRLSWLLVAAVIGIQACGPKVHELSLREFRLDPGPTATQRKSNIEITVKPIRISDIYEYPDLFGFRLQDFPDYRDSKFLKKAYPVGPKDLQWEYPFSDSREYLYIYWVKIDNGTEHIVRMRDARVYFIAEGQEPIAAVADFEGLLDWADYFERRSPYDLPAGFYRNLVLYHRPSYKLINDLGREILPGFAYEGLLVFPTMPEELSTGTISFFDVTVKTDAAGRPVEKTRFDFPLKQRMVRMWYDAKEKMWKSGTPVVND